MLELYQYAGATPTLVTTLYEKQEVAGVGSSFSVRTATANNVNLKAGTKYALFWTTKELRTNPGATYKDPIAWGLVTASNAPTIHSAAFNGLPNLHSAANPSSGAPAFNPKSLIAPRSGQPVCRIQVTGIPLDLPNDEY